MPRPNQGPRLRWLKKRGKYYIVWTEAGRSCERSTGTANSQQAEEALAEFIRDRRKPTGPSFPDSYMIADALDFYGREHAPDTASPERIGYAIEALLGFWGEQTVASIMQETCKAYRRHRGVVIPPVIKGV
ncbi:hypothetical protein AQ1_02498 [alpha proteobacterium Q-1]|nr:hypothetical protein AQ1_02498 [alpha proteobacterium Q-1]